MTEEEQGKWDVKGKEEKKKIRMIAWQEGTEEREYKSEKYKGKVERLFGVQEQEKGQGRREEDYE